MRILALIFGLVLTAVGVLSFRTQLNARTAEVPALEIVEGESASPAARAKVDFERQIKPIFEAKCQPCHFNGGTMYQRLPFDRPATITTLGTKLFSRIKDEEQRRLIKEFLDQQ
jgi:hypothetical protein